MAENSRRPMDIDELIEYSESHGYHPEVISKLKDYRALLYFMASFDRRHDE